MNPRLVWPANEHMSTEEARLACRLILRDIRPASQLNWQTVNPAAPDLPLWPPFKLSSRIQWRWTSYRE